MTKDNETPATQLLCAAGKITSARDERSFGTCTVYGTVDGEEVQLFSYYIDELSITPQSVVGLDVSAARKLKRDADVKYLRS